MQDPLHSQDCARLLKALADPERLRIVECLRAGPRNVSDLADELRQELANISHHLGVLRKVGIVADRKDGKYVVYSLHPDVFRPAAADQASDCLDLGCCRLELNR
jgi:ArsR family transcriptional regulator